MKRLLVLAAMLFVVLGASFGGQGLCYADEGAKVVATECGLYQTPSFDTPLLDAHDQAVTLKFGDIVTPLEGGQESEDFVFVEFQDARGYVFKYYIRAVGDEQSVYPVFNASVESEQATVYDLAQNETNIVLQKGTELYLYEGYHKNQDFTAVCFVTEGGGLYYGYLKTKDLAPYGVNAAVITGIVVAASCITIILLLIFMKKRKVKKQKVA